MLNQFGALTGASALLCLLSCTPGNKAKPIASNTVLPKLEQSSNGVYPQGSPDPATFSVFPYQSTYINTAMQKYTLDAGKTGVITGRKGLRVTFQPDDLEYPDGTTPTGAIDVQLLELTNYNELFRANAATVSGGRLLASGGSYFIGMSSGGLPLRIRPKHYINVEFPKLYDGEMELFYGQRDQNNAMNWTPAGSALVANPSLTAPREDIRFSDTSAGTNFLLDMREGEYTPHYFRSMKDVVYYYDQAMTIENLVKKLNARETRLVIDTVYNWPKDLPTGRWIDSNHLTRVYGPMYTYWLISASAKKRKEERMARLKEWRCRAEEEWKTNSLVGQIQKYYAPSVIGRLGWINCDRYYNQPAAPDVELDIPITMTNRQLNYFIVFPSINGLLNQNLFLSPEQQPRLSQLPNDAPVTLVGFIKKDSLVYRCQANFTPGRVKRVKLDFTEISRVELQSMFGRNIRI